MIINRYQFKKKPVVEPVDPAVLDELAALRMMAPADEPSAEGTVVEEDDE
jgi:hypothetical protein